MLSNMQNTFSTTPNYFHYIANKNLSRETMKAPIAFMLGVLLGNVACLPKDVAKPAQMTQMAKSAQKTETEELSRERRWAKINSLGGISFHFGSPGLLGVWGKGNREAPTLRQIATSQKESRLDLWIFCWENFSWHTFQGWDVPVGQPGKLNRPALGSLHRPGKPSPDFKSPLQWQPFTSQDAFWKGGPRIDKTDGSIDGGGNAFVGWFFDSLATPRLCFLWDINNARDHCYKLSVSHDGKSPSQFYRITGNNNNINNIEILLLRICENIFVFSGSLRLLFLLPAWIICW